MSKIEGGGWVLFILGLGAALFGVSGVTSGDGLESSLGMILIAGGAALASMGFLMVLCGLIHRRIEATGREIVQAIDRRSAEGSPSKSGSLQRD